MEIPKRNDVSTANTWDLGKLYNDEAAWEKDFEKFSELTARIPNYKGRLSESADSLLEVMGFYNEGLLLGERLGHWAWLRQSEDEGNSESRGRIGRFMMMGTKAESEWSFFTPELLSVPEEVIRGWLKDKRFDDYRIFIEKTLRQKPHILSEAEERILAMGSDFATTPDSAFSVLTNVDMNFGSIDTAEGPRPLSQSSLASFLRNGDRTVREKAYKAFYSEFEKHKNTLAELFSGQCKYDHFQASARKYSSSRGMKLYPDNVPEAVYDNLVKTINDNLPVLHDYYRLRKDTLKLPELRHWDVYLPLVDSVKVRHSWDEAVNVIEKALAPLGEEYTGTLCNGLRGRWADRYENQGKSSGAFSYGTYTSDPYILMNFKEDVLSDVFTLAHEGGHSMHSWYSVKANPFMQYSYTIFEAEVASTFNEELLFHHLYETAESRELKAYLLSTRVDEILGTLFRQTMFAEFEHKAHALLEGGTALTVDILRSEYRKLLEKYFGPAMVLEENSDMEGLRIPHFYSSYYVYKYATGISAAIALARGVLDGKEGARENYFKFLSSGGSRYPIDALKVAGVDMTGPEPVQAACDEFARLVKELRAVLQV